MNIDELKKIYARTILIEAEEVNTPAAKELENDPKEQALVDELTYKIAVGKSSLFAKAPYLARIIYGLNIKVVKSDSDIIPTMAVDDRGNIYINPAFGNKLSDREFYGVLAHEALHKANGTFLRGRNREPHLWNIATDSVMNYWLRQDGFDLPAEGIIPDNNGVFKFPNSNLSINVLDDKGEPLAPEDVYDQLIKQKDKLEKEIEKKGKPKSGQGQGKPQPGQGQGQGQGMSKEEAEKAAEDYFKGLDNKTDKHLTPEEAKQVNPEVEDVLSEEDLQRAEKARRDAIMRGMSDPTTSSVGRGSGSGGLRKLIQKSIPVVVDWKGIVKRYLRVASSKTPTWSKLSKRGLAGGYLSPGSSTSPNKLDAVFAVDTSGSVGPDELALAFNFIRDIAKSVPNLNVRILLWHQDAYYISKPITTKGALEETLKSVTAQSGGTTISNIDSFLTKAKVKPVVVIYITDGYVEPDPKFGNYQKLFIIVNDQANNESVREGIEKLFKKHGQIVFTQTLKN